MNHVTFIETFERLGFDVAEQPAPDGDERGIVVASNKNGDEVSWSVVSQPEQWGVYVDPAQATLDEATFGWGELIFEDDHVVFPDSEGTRRKEFGYGRASFDGDVIIDSRGTTITETHEHRL